MRTRAQELVTRFFCTLRLNGLFPALVRCSSRAEESASGSLTRRDMLGKAAPPLVVFYAGSANQRPPHGGAVGHKADGPHTVSLCVDPNARDTKGASSLHHLSWTGGQDLENCLIQPGNSPVIKKQKPKSKTFKDRT